MWVIAATHNPGGGSINMAKDKGFQVNSVNGGFLVQSHGLSDMAFKKA